MKTSNSYKCPVCKKPLTATEYLKALGLWKEQQEHIQHLVGEQKKWREQAKREKQKIETERAAFQARARALQLKEAEIRREAKVALARVAKDAERRLRDQRLSMEKSLEKRLQLQVKSGVAKGIEQQKVQFRKQATALRKSQNKMAQLENSLKLSATKYDQASEEIKRLKTQIEKGITPQIEGLLEEHILLAKLKDLFPSDTFDHPGKGGDIIQCVVEHGHVVGRIVYECKRVKHFDKHHVDQAKEARRLRQADFAVLVTNAFPSKKQYYFVEKTVFVISPVSLEPITHTLRDSLTKLAALRLSNEAKSKAVQQICDYLSSNEYSNRVNDMASQLMDVGRELKGEVATHKKLWEKRYRIYATLYKDVGAIDGRLRGLIHNLPGTKVPLLPDPQRDYVEIKELASGV